MNYIFINLINTDESSARLIMHLFAESRHFTVDLLFESEGK